MLASQVEQQQGDDEKKPLSISEALDVAKGSLEKLKLRVLGEVSEVNVKPGYANAYFTLKDETGTLPCQMWHDRFEKCGITLEVGMMVELVGRFSLYPKKGRMHFQVFAISVAGEGMLRQQVAILQRKLEVEGLMAPERKVPVPAYPMKIGVVTSPRGDAIHDVLRTTRRRFPLAHIYVAGVPVEGARAPEYIVEGMRACFRARVEVILLVRGGGSYEDLMPFNDEQLARAIAKCPIPVVTGIGHEPDTTIADLVGDLRASTPTGAAEAVTVPNIAARSPAAIDGRVYRAASAAANPACNAFARPIRHATHIQRPSVDVRKRPYHARHSARQALSSSSGQYRARQNPPCGICLAAFRKASCLRSRFRKARKLLLRGFAAPPLRSIEIRCAFLRNATGFVKSPRNSSPLRSTK